MSRLITSDIPIEEVVERFPEAVGILSRRGVICIQCGAPVWGTLAEAVQRAGLDVDELLAELNRETGGIRG